MVCARILWEYKVPLSQNLYDFMEDEHNKWHPSLPYFLTFYCSGPYYRIWFFYLITRGFRRTFATASEQMTLTPPDTWSCPTHGLAWVLILRPISPELVLFPDFSVSNISRYFWFSLYTRLPSFRNWWPVSLHRYAGDDDISGEHFFVVSRSLLPVLYCTPQWRSISSFLLHIYTCLFTYLLCG